MPRPKKQTTVDHEKLMVVAQYAPDLLTREELLQVATGAITPAPKQRRKRRKRRKKAVAKKASKKNKLKKIPPALERLMVAELKRQRRTPKKKAPKNGAFDNTLATVTTY